MPFFGQRCQLSHTSTWYRHGAVMSFSSIWFHCMCSLFCSLDDFHIAFMLRTVFCIALERYFPCKFHSLVFNRFKVLNTCWWVLYSFIISRVRFKQIIWWNLLDRKSMKHTWFYINLFWNCQKWFKNIQKSKNVWISSSFFFHLLHL